MEPIVSSNTPSTSAMSNRTTGIINSASSSAHSAVNSIAGAADETVARAKPAIDKVVALAHQVVDKAAGVAAPTADWLNEKGESIKATQKQLVADTRTYVSANPLTAVGFAVIAGFLLSRLIRR